ncbi:MAG TPA: hypothetical protein VJU85_00640 [Nitrososphaeraceae archaeon]|nr:hypothetical protein [Nitrososphaeraceae archaeon]
MTHNEIDIDQFILLTIYPSIALFGITFFAKKAKLVSSIQYCLQAFSCIVFSVIYLMFVPNGGAQGLALVLLLFSGILLLLARKHAIHPEEDRSSSRKIPFI